MIPRHEFYEAAREFGLDPSTIERDYAQNWLLFSFRKIPMALKGGTGIRKVFIEDYRFSDDLDFTLLEPIESGTLQAMIREAVTQAGNESGIAFEETLPVKETKNGTKATVFFRILNRGSASPVKIDLDLTNPENEKILLPVKELPVFHHYSDTLDVSVSSYSLEEIMAEKIRSVFQRTRSRDIYDIWQLAGKVDRDLVKSILPEKCAYKEINLDLSLLEQKREKFAAVWRVSLGHQMQEVPDFDLAYRKVIEEVEFFTRP